MIAQLNRLEEWLAENKSKHHLFPIRALGYVFLFFMLMISNFLAVIRWPFASLIRRITGKRDHSQKQVLENEVNEVGATGLEDILQNRKYVLIDFWGEWCGPCIMMNKPLKRLAESESIDCTIAKVNTVNHQDLASDYNVKGLPTLLLMKDNKEIKRYAGALSYHELRNFVTD